MKIKVVQMVYGKLLEPNSWFQWVEKINQLYCDIHGYEYIVDRRTEISPDRHGNWMKVTAIRDCLHDCDYVLSLEADCAVYCHSIKLEEDVIHLIRDKSVLTTINTLKYGMWNEDYPQVWSMLFRNNDTAHEILAAWDNVHRLDEHKHMAFKFPYDEDGWRHVIHHKYGDHICTLKDYHLLATMHGYFIRHLAMQSDHNRFWQFRNMWASPMMERNRKLLTK